PELFKLLPAYPNPFNPSTKIDYVLSNSNIINLSVYDIYGRQIEELLNEYHRAGEYSITWNASRQPSGIYFIKMMSGKFNSTQKVVLLK
ncbi:MAG: T9SS type A sorting domain-containing protein, partial [Candidatus Marinimicrobia bacterium]|nr:T9SS type A sorting domain-containing protein [Candidatus Neomarinimicrobiota bacterium]MBT7973045.1 T9SS type A sorting domain-containing protein [Candidatus Neomarinimicrobiota bacterium]